MIAVTLAAIAKLRAIQAHHPEDPVIRISVRDLDDSRLSFSITLEASTQPDDDVQQIDGLIIAVDQRSVPRMERVTVDYTEANGFRFLHDEEGRSLPPRTIPTLN
jgi:Fe-S cluster assembly iron-binding protein IscA